MVKLSELREQSDEPGANKSIDFLFATVKMPSVGGRSQYIYCGWNEDESPVVSTKPEMLKRDAQADLRANPAIPFMYPEDMIGYTPKVLEFREVGRPVDNRDTRANFVQDLLTISGVDPSGAIQFAQIKELTLLDAILRGQITSKFNGADSYTVCVPDDVTQSLYFILFRPPTDATSNEFIYRRFLLRIMKSLVDLDHHQQPPDQKGYIHVMQAAAVKLLEKQQRQIDRSMTKDKQLLIEFGLEESEEKTAQQLIAGAPVPVLRSIVEKMLEIIQETFDEGR